MVELLNMTMHKKMQKTRTVELNEPVLKEEEEKK